MGEEMWDLECAGCCRTFDLVAREVRRQLKKDPDRRFYCSRGCYSRSAGKSNLGQHLGNGRVERLDPGNRQDEYSPFRYFLRKARARDPGHDLDLEYLRQLWLDQGGRCGLSGLVMDLPRNTLVWEERARDPWKPSLDRIDSNQGYLRGNVRYVVMIANLAKSLFDDEVVLTFCRAVVAAHSEAPGASKDWAPDE